MAERVHVQLMFASGNFRGALVLMFCNNLFTFLKLFVLDYFLNFKDLQEMKKTTFREVFGDFFKQFTVKMFLSDKVDACLGLFVVLMVFRFNID